METSMSASAEAPRNGLAGLKHWRHDIVAGLLVSLISLPFSLGIAVASGAPPIAGLVSAIIAGLLLPFLGGSFVTISGPAAGLAPVLLASMLTLGKGDLAVGYPLLLGAIFMAGCVQLVLARFKAAKFSALFPSTVVEAMLASIGLMIIAKQLPNFLGHSYKAREFFGILAETPAELGLLNPKVFGLGVACLALTFALASAKSRWLKAVPPPVIAVLFGLVAGRLIGIGPEFLIHIPDNILEHGIVTPNFRGLFSDNSLWLALTTIVITLTLVDGVESLATATAVDKIDPYRRKSDPNRVLFAMGISNICSSFAGGLTIIPGGVKSKACIEGGGRTLWANFYNAIFLLIFLFVARPLINFIPLTALAAILIYTGYKLCAPRVWRHIAHIGREQLLLFAFTIFATLCTDLLWGIVMGMVAKLLMNAWFAASALERTPDGAAPAPAGLLATLRQVPEQFRNPVLARESVDGGYHIYLGRQVVCFNALYVHHALASIPRGVAAVSVHLTELVALIDHTSCDHLIHYVEDLGRREGIPAEIVGLDRMRGRSDDSSCMRLGPAILAGERRQALDELARLALLPADLGRYGPGGVSARLTFTPIARPAGGLPPHPIAIFVSRAGRYVVVKIRACRSWLLAPPGRRRTPLGELDRHGLLHQGKGRPGPSDHLAHHSLSGRGDRAERPDSNTQPHPGWWN